MSADLDKLDAALGSILAQGWNDPPAVEAGAQIAPNVEVTPVVEPSELVVKYPPLPVREDAVVPVKHTRSEVSAPNGAEGSEGDDEARNGVYDIGLLADLASGRKTAVEAAQAAGVTVGELQSDLAVALHEIDPKEIAKALGIQAAEQQLKSGALYGAVLASLVDDMIAGRMKPDTKIELAKLLGKNGRIEPKEDKSVGLGGGFTLNINLGAGAPPITIDTN